MKKHFLIVLVIFLGLSHTPALAQTNLNEQLEVLKWRNIGPFRGGRSVAASGVLNDPLTYYMGTTGGGLWKTTDAGQHWHNISDGYFKTGSVGAVAVADSDPNVLYVGMGEHAPRGVMTSYGDGVYKSTDAGKSWEHLGLEQTLHIAGVSIHPANPEVVYVAAQGALHGPSTARGVYKSTDGGKTWRRTLYVDENTGCAHLVMDPTNPRILYAAMWEHRRLPWQVISGGPGSGLYKSTDGGENWTAINQGLPELRGKMSLAASAANPDKVYALVEGDTQKEAGGLFVSENGGKDWTRVSKDHRLVQRAWYYIEVFADPSNENTVYVLSAPCLKSIDGGKSWTRLSGTHGDYHHLWINPKNGQNLCIANDGGAAISFDGGNHWSRQSNMSTAQFYRLNVDNAYPYRIYSGQQDNSSVRIASSNPSGRGITARDWTYSAGGESAFLAFNPDKPELVLGGSYQGTIEALDPKMGEGRRIMAAPHQYLALDASEMRYRFNWNAPIIWSPADGGTFYHGAQMLLKTTDNGHSWTEVSPDLTRNEVDKQGKGGIPLTNEGAGGENYNTISYVVESPHETGTIWVGSDDGLVHLTRNGGESWTNVTPSGLSECLINAIEVSPHDPATAYLATTRYKFNDFRPGLYKTTNYGQSWSKIDNRIPDGAYTRVVREDTEVKGLLFAGTETGLYISYSGGQTWESLPLNLPIVPITDLKVQHHDLIATTQGRSIWILDDLELLRQYAKRPGNPHIYQPAVALLGRAGSSMNSNIGTDLLDGVNPANGLVIYYYLPESETITLNVLDESGQVIRTFTSEANPDFQSYRGGPDEDPILSTQVGLNRFVWDLRYPNLIGAPKAYIEGSYQGAPVPPGQYELQLIIGTEVISTKATVEPRPDLPQDVSLYQEQTTFIRTVSARVNEIHGAVNELQAINARIQQVLKRLDTDLPAQAVLQQEAQTVIEAITAWDAQLVQRKSQSYDDVINFRNGLTADYLFLKGQADSTIPQVTMPMKARLTELDSKWATLKAQYETLLKEQVADLEKALQEAGLGILR